MPDDMIFVRKLKYFSLLASAGSTVTVAVFAVGGMAEELTRSSLPGVTEPVTDCGKCASAGGADRASPRAPETRIDRSGLDVRAIVRPRLPAVYSGSSRW